MTIITSSERKQGSRFRLRVAVAALGLLLLSSPAFGQEADELLEEAGVPLFPSAKFAAEGGYRWQGEADIDGGGDVQVNRYDLGLASRTPLGDALRWNNTLYFGVGDYDFGGGGLGGLDPWDTILNLRLGTRLSYAINENWGVSGGGIFIFTPETGADWGDSFTGGGSVSAEYRNGDTFFLSLGVAVISQIEDDARVVPVVGMNWVPHPQWAIRVGAIPAGGGTGTAAEVAYRIIEPLELGLGVLYHERRFRLDDSGTAPGGVGEDNSLPVRFRLGWDITESLSLHTVAGVVLAGRLRLEDRNGNRLTKQDYDPAAYLGLRLSGRF